MPKPAVFLRAARAAAVTAPEGQAPEVGTALRGTGRP